MAMLIRGCIYGLLFSLPIWVLILVAYLLMKAIGG